MTVTINWRRNFGLNDEGALIDMDVEVYHGAYDSPFACSPRRRLAEDGNCGARACQRDGFGRAFWRIAAGIEHIVERQCEPLCRYGYSVREGFRTQGRYAAADADGL